MKTVSIIGAGQLGSRHLQGLKTALSELDIWVMDANQDSLNMAKIRYEAIESTTFKNVHYVDSLEMLPTVLDLVIIATGSKPRAAIVKSLLARSKVKYLILEKFLFPRLMDYDEISKLLEKDEVKCWVNCPRRMWSLYSEIKSAINSDEPVFIKKKGKDWGLCCNSVHYIDIWMYLAGDNRFEIDLSLLETRIVESKRNGYIELMGEEHMISVNGDELYLSSFDAYDGDTSMLIINGKDKIIVNEATGVWFCNGVEHKTKVPFQSELTGTLADDLFLTGNCKLTSFTTSVAYHKPYLRAVLDFVNIIQNTNSDICPIT